MKRRIYIIMIVCLCILCCACAGSNYIELGDDAYDMSKSDYKAACETVKYKDFRYVEKYKEKHKKIKCTGEVEEVCSEEDSDSNVYSTYRVNITKKDYGSIGTGYVDDIYVYYMLEKHPKLFEGDIVTLYGEMTDSVTYTTIMEQERTIPAMVAVYVKIKK